MIYFSDSNDDMVMDAPRYTSDVCVPVVACGKIQYAQADGDELEHACEILGRPMPKARVFTFVGDDARTIAINW